MQAPLRTAHGIDRSNRLARTAPTMLPITKTVRSVSDNDVTPRNAAAGSRATTRAATAERFGPRRRARASAYVRPTAMVERTMFSTMSTQALRLPEITMANAESAGKPGGRATKRGSATL